MDELKRFVECRLSMARKRSSLRTVLNFEHQAFGAVDYAVMSGQVEREDVEEWWNSIRDEFDMLCWECGQQ